MVSFLLAVSHVNDIPTKHSDTLFLRSGQSVQQGRQLLVISQSQLQELGAVNYQVNVTNTGKIAGSVSVLAMMTSDVRGYCNHM